MTRRWFGLLFLLVLVLRVSLAADYRGNVDTKSYLMAVAAVETGQNIYEFTDRYNYAPVWAYVLTGLWRASTPNVPVFIFLVGLLLIWLLPYAPHQAMRLARVIGVAAVLAAVMLAVL